MRFPVPRLATAAALAMTSGAALAGSLGVGPTRIELDARTPVQTLTVQNTGSSPSLVQLDVHLWKQAETEDQLTPTTALVATPRVFELEPGASRVVRIGLRDPRPGAIESAYRVYVREVQPAAAAAGVQLRFLMQVGVPVFVTPDVAGSKAELAWRLDAANPHCRRIAIVNRGLKRERILGLEYREGGRTVWRSDAPQYLLAGSRRFLNDAPCLTSVPDTASELRVRTERGEVAPARASGDE